MQAEATDLEVFLEAVGLEEVGEFEGADVAALSADFTLEVANDGTDVVEGVAGAEGFEPHPLAVEAQAEGLAGELAVELVSLEELTCQEIATRLGMPLGTVTKTLSRAYALLRERLGEGRTTGPTVNRAEEHELR